jgi:hypothetical protein
LWFITIAKAAASKLVLNRMNFLVRGNYLDTQKFGFFGLICILDQLGISVDNDKDSVQSTIELTWLFCNEVLTCSAVYMCSPVSIALSEFNEFSS